MSLRHVDPWTQATTAGLHQESEMGPGTSTLLRTDGNTGGTSEKSRAVMLACQKAKDLMGLQWQPFRHAVVRLGGQ